MNEEMILSMVEPYVKDNCISYSDFVNVFHMLSIKEQVVVYDILDKHEVIVLDEEPAEEKDDFTVLYDPELFQDEETNEENYQSEYLKVNTDVRQSNDILCVLIQQGDMQAKQDLCTKNAGLVKKEVNKYQRFFGHDLEFDELMQAGMIGMLKAAEKFDISLGYQFSTYALYWIRQSITREIGDNGFTIRLPIHMMERIYKVTWLERKYEMKGLAYERRLEAIASDMGIKVDDVEYCLLLRSNFLNDVSLDVPVGEEHDITLEEFIVDNRFEPVETEAMNQALHNTINEVLSTLTEKERRIIEMRYGLNGEREHTLEEVGKKYNVTRERIRQIQAKALRKLKHPSRSRKLKDYC